MQKYWSLTKKTQFFSQKMKFSEKNLQKVLAFHGEVQYNAKRILCLRSPMEGQSTAAPKCARADAEERDNEYGYQERISQSCL
jgi:hypothetical protein